MDRYTIWETEDLRQVAKTMRMWLLVAVTWSEYYFSHNNKRKSQGCRNIYSLIRRAGALETFTRVVIFGCVPADVWVWVTKIIAP